MIGALLLGLGGATRPSATFVAGRVLGRRTLRPRVVFFSVRWGGAWMWLEQRPTRGLLSRVGVCWRPGRKVAGEAETTSRTGPGSGTSSRGACPSLPRPDPRVRRFPAAGQRKSRRNRQRGDPRARRRY